MMVFCLFLYWYLLCKISKSPNPARFSRATKGTLMWWWEPNSKDHPISPTDTRLKSTSRGRICKLSDHSKSEGQPMLWEISAQMIEPRGLSLPVQGIMPKELLTAATSCKSKAQSTCRRKLHWSKWIASGTLGNSLWLLCWLGILLMRLWPRLDSSSQQVGLSLSMHLTT